MKCPSSSASAERNSARISSSVIIFKAAIRPRAEGLQHFSDEALEAPGTHAYRGPQNRGAASRAPIPTTSPGVKMRLIGWAMAVAAAGLTPAAAQAPAGAPPPATAAPAAAAPAPANAAPVPGSVGHMIPTPGIGEPDGRKGVQDQVTPIGREAEAFHNGPLMIVAVLISILVLALLLYAMIRFRRGVHPTPSRNSHNTLIEVIWTLVPVLILVGIAIPSIKLLRHQYSPPPADLTVKVTGHQWYWSYEYPDNGVSFDSYMLKEKNDPT